MAITKAIPQVWHAAIKRALLAEAVFAAPPVINTDYQGDISAYGDTVKIIGLTNITIKNYTKNTTLAPPDQVTDTETLLIIDQAKYFNFGIDDIEQAQTRPKLMAEASARAAWGLRDTVDKFLVGTIQPASSVVADSPRDFTVKGAAYEALVDMGTLLTANNVPTGNRWCVGPPGFYGMLQKDDRFVHSTPQGDNTLRNGDVGSAAGFQVRVSNNCPNNMVFVGHQMSTTFAQQLANIEPYRPQTTFADALRGLILYGAKVVYPEAVVRCQAGVPMGLMAEGADSEPGPDATTGDHKEGGVVGGEGTSDQAAEESEAAPKRGRKSEGA